MWDNYDDMYAIKILFSNYCDNYRVSTSIYYLILIKQTELSPKMGEGALKKEFEMFIGKDKSQLYMQQQMIKVISLCSIDSFRPL